MTALDPARREELLIASHTVEPVQHTGRALFAVVERLIAEARAEGAAEVRARVEAQVAVWQAELDSGAIRDKDARYCWGIAVRETRAALADPTEGQS